MKTKNVTYSPSQMIEIEPMLKMSEQFVMRENNKARKKAVYWYQVWRRAKKLCHDYVGFGAKKTILSNMECHDAWYYYLKSLTNNCK